MNFKKLTKAQFYELWDYEQVHYINNLSNYYSNGDFVELKEGDVIDLVTGEVIEDVFEYLLNLNNEPTEFQGKCFCEVKILEK